jgi:hypothetical protein
MSFWENLILVVIGVLIGSTSYISKSFVFEPLRDFRKTQGSIRNRLKYFANVLTSPGSVKRELSDEASRTCRELSCELEERYYSIPFRKTLIKSKLIQPEKNIEEAAQMLIFLSNSAHSGEPLKNNDAIQKISSMLWFGKPI